MERLQKVIANSGYCSRRKAEELILKGQVYVNGEMENITSVSTLSRLAVSVPLSMSANRRHFR